MPLLKSARRDEDANESSRAERVGFERDAYLA
ncbi:hypothetical protein ALC56_03756 [Trachymyrmex septentrionalis]|uniref:Uncharacterized protein n=1 Tax=Trachymyrmex septentrionalis TaxID=34720 RepID=A0A195FN51_9HYME|nr:hypothetical protein ALC56_03756 [Trachymyrmex septentrionalis]